MVDITNCKESCFALLFNGECAILKKQECGAQCKFYKPVDCRDWIVVERKGRRWLLPPEEYYEM